MLWLLYTVIKNQLTITDTQEFAIRVSLSIFFCVWHEYESLRLFSTNTCSGSFNMGKRCFSWKFSFLFCHLSKPISFFVPVLESFKYYLRFVTLLFSIPALYLRFLWIIAVANLKLQKRFGKEIRLYYSWKGLSDWSSIIDWVRSNFDLLRRKNTGYTCFF